MRFLTFILACLVTQANIAQVYSGADRDACNQKFSFALERSLADKPVAEVVGAVGRSFLGTNYVANTLDTGTTEKLTINLTGLDCTTFLENTLTFGRCIKKQTTSFDAYAAELEFIRYRNGKIGDYTSRLHYFADWIYENGHKGLVEDITKGLGGVPITFNVFFMSRNSGKYAMLKANPEFVPVIKNQEDSVNARTYYYIPKQAINREVEGGIREGDLIAITTNIPGLDIGHVGVAVKERDGRIHFMHAPLVGAVVQISSEPLGDYLMKIKKHTGIIVLRVKEPVSTN